MSTLLHTPPESFERYSRFLSTLLHDAASDAAESEREMGTEEQEERDQHDALDEERDRWTTIRTEAIKVARSMPRPPLRIGSYRAVPMGEKKMDLRF